MEKTRGIHITLLLMITAMLLATGCDKRKPTEIEPEDVFYGLNVVSDRDVIYADNGKTTARITATVTNVEGEPLVGVTVVFSALQGAIASNITTNSAGQAVATFDDKGQPGEQVRIVARYSDPADNTVRDTVYLDILPMEALVGNFMTTTRPPSGIIEVTEEDSSFAAEVISQVRDLSGVAVENVLVNFRVLEGGEIGYLDLAADSSDGAGKATAIFASNPGTTGMVKVESYIEGDALNTLLREHPGRYDFGELARDAAPAEIIFRDTVTLVYAPFGLYTIRLEAFDVPIFADNGATVARLIAFVKDDDEQPVQGINVSFSSDLGSVNSPRTTSDAGIAESEFSDLGSSITEDTIAQIRAAVIHPFFGVLRDTIEVLILAENPNEPEPLPFDIDLTAAHDILPPPDNPEISRTTLTATVTDSSGFPVNANVLVEFSTDIGFVEPHKTTDESGSVQAEFTMGDSAGIARVYARSGTAVDSVLITIRPGEPAYLVIPPSNPNRIVVRGGWGAESTTIRAEIRDARGELVDEPVQVRFTLGPTVPAGVNLNGVGLVASDTTNYGVASVTLNSGTQAGPVRVTAAVMPDSLGISSSSIPVTVVAGAPAFIEVDIDINEILPIGGGMYEAELAARVWDRYTNPVEDSTQIYWRVEPDSIASVIGSSYTNNENRNDEQYHGLAWSLLYYNSDETFNRIQVFAQTWGAEGEPIVGTLNDAEDDSLLIPFSPGDLTIIPQIQFWDFQPANAPNPNPKDIVLTAMLKDYYNNPIKNARILFTAIGAQSWFPVDDLGLPIVRTDDQGVAQITAFFNASLCTPNFDAENNVSSYNPFTAYVGAILLDPQSVSSDQVAIEFRRSIQ